MTFSPAALRSALPAENTIRGFWVALSGGLDSVVLLHALASLRLAVPVKALHIHHGISANADFWQAHCARLCERQGISFYSERVTIKQTGKGLEEAARVARYEIFDRYIDTENILLTGHHADDQAETLLLRLMRGTGPRGLAAMASDRPFGQGRLVRPLLNFTRTELQEYAEAQGLPWIEDESNCDIHYDRNYLRQQVMPALRERWPSFTRRWQQTAELCASSDSLLDELAAEWLAAAEPRAERCGISLSLPYLANLSSARRHHLLRYWLREQDVATPEQQHLEQCDAQIFSGREDTKAEVRWGDVCLRRFRDRLYLLTSPVLMSQSSESVGVNIALKENEIVRLSPQHQVVFEFCAEVASSGYLRCDLTGLSIRFRKGGERCQPQGRKHSQTLKKLLQEFDLEPWWRSQVPLLYCGDQLAAVGDLWVCEDFAATEGQTGYRLRWLLT